jgi:RNA polymerase sigma-70 factor (ECF subfamily)
VTDREFEKCVKKILKNDKDGLREIYDQYRVYIYSCMWKIVQNKENAEDLTADFFIKFWETADKYKFGGKHRAWLATIARNMAIDFVRKNKKMILSDEMPETGDSNTSGMEELVVGNMFLKEALETLNEGEQEVVHLKIVGELTFKEIAKVLKLPMGTITWRYQNAIKKLRRCGYE